MMLIKSNSRYILKMNIYIIYEKQLIPAVKVKKKRLKRGDLIRYSDFEKNDWV